MNNLPPILDPEQSSDLGREALARVEQKSRSWIEVFWPTVPEQETYDLIVGHLRAQGGRSQTRIYGNWICQYRGDHGYRDPGGVILPDEYYRPEFDRQGFGWKGVVRTLGTGFGHSVELVSLLQYVHDIRPVTEWETHFKRVATEFDLVYRPRGEDSIVRGSLFSNRPWKSGISS
jgi:hypothetical protein